MAEDPLLQLPSPGTIQEVDPKRSWHFEDGSATLHLSISAGQVLLPDDEIALGSLFVTAPNWADLITRTRQVLRQLWIAGSIQTNERFLFELLGQPWVRAAMYNSGFVEEDFFPATKPPEALLAAFGGVCMIHPRMDVFKDQARWAVADQWVPDGAKFTRWKEGPHFWGTDELPGISGIIEPPEGRELRACAYPLAPLPWGRWLVRIGRWVLTVRRLPPPGQTQLNKEPKILALAAGKVHALLCKEGSRVPAHTHFLTLQSLGTLIPHASPVPFTLKRWLINPNDIVDQGQILGEITLE